MKNKNKKILAPSILSANFMNLKDEIQLIEKAGADVIHCDIMDGHFVPNLTFGPSIIKQIKQITNLPLDVHLMITNSEETIDNYIDAGANYISVHYESVTHLNRLINHIKSKNVKAGVALNPSTPIEMLTEIFPLLDFVLLMSVNPGFGGQKFIEETIPKIEKFNKMKSKFNNKNILLEIDGGVSLENSEKLSNRGVNMFVVGSAIFNSKDKTETVKEFKKKINI
ncbi:MAG: ribulose-phosphate 3-epimerase [Candidatus Marinimicrobia bacterium]|nr:ribulose-phosphate 3-epimerase [Candidatus Neomarinimicrobiota bacterium]